MTYSDDVKNLKEELCLKYSKSLLNYDKDEILGIICSRAASILQGSHFLLIISYTCLRHVLKSPLLIRQNASASGARPNPQGSFRYGSINITDTYMLKVLPPVAINGKVRATINGISFVKPNIPFRLADQHKLRGIYKLDFPSKPLNRPPVMDRSLINATYKGFIEIILQNNDTTIQSFHMDGYSFFVAG